MTKILHIFSESNHIILKNLFWDESIINDVLFIGEPFDSKGIKYLFESNRANLKKVIGIANGYDLVVLYYLKPNKAYIANRINPKIPIIWRFFGFELYSKMSDEMYSDITKKYLALNAPAKPTLENKITKFKGGILRSIGKDIGENELEKSWKRINYFQCLAREEYDFLSDRFSLPEFLQDPYIKINARFDLDLKKGDKVLLGNSRTPFNNHFEMIDMVAPYPELKKYAFVSYGKRGNEYFKEVLKRMKSIENFTPITEVIPITEVEKLYSEIDAFVHNSYRQMATGNMMIAFQYGVKIYLNKKNILYHLLLNNGFLIYDMDNFEEDYKNGKITLTKEEAYQNVKAMCDYSEKYSIADFVGKIKEIIGNTE